MATAIDAAIAAAQTVSTAVIEQAVNASVPALVPQGRQLTDDDMLGSSTVVDHYLKTSDTAQVTLGTTKGWFNEITVSLNLRQISRGFSVCYGTPFVYERTTNAASTTKGGSWNDAIARAAKYGKQPYDSWELPMTLLEDVGEVEAGAVIGYTTSWSSFNSPTGFKVVYVKAKELYGPDAVIKLVVGAKATNKNGKKFNEPTFTLVGEISQD